MSHISFYDVTIIDCKYIKICKLMLYIKAYDLNILVVGYGIIQHTGCRTYSEISNCNEYQEKYHYSNSLLKIHSLCHIASPKYVLGWVIFPSDFIYRI